MYKIQINDANAVNAAIHWCNNLNITNWHIHTNWPGKGFIFKFNDHKDASWFGLHWAH